MSYTPIHLSKLFRAFEPKDLRAWLVIECPALDDDALWKGKSRKAIKAQVVPVLLSHLDKPACRQLDAHAERIALLADRAGREAWTYMRSKLVEALGAAEVAAIELGGNGYFRALALFRHDPKLFVQVEVVRYADEWRGGKLYSGFQVPKDKTPRFDAVTKATFEAAVDELFQSHGEIVAEHFEQEQEDEDGEARTLHHFHVSLKGLEEFVDTMVDKQIVAGSIFPLNQIRIVYIPADGLLEVYAHDRNHHNDIGRLFAIHVLGESGDITLLPERRYALERLRESTPLPIDPADLLRIDGIDVMEVRFAAGSRGSDFTIKRGSKETRTVYQMAESQFRERDPFKSVNPIFRVRIVIRLRKTGPNEPARKLPIVITLPNRCNIRHRCDGDQRLGERYVRYWGLVVKEEEPADAVPAGLAHTTASS